MNVINLKQIMNGIVAFQKLLDVAYRLSAALREFYNIVHICI